MSIASFKYTCPAQKSAPSQQTPVPQVPLTVYQVKRHQLAVRQRRRLVRARAKFQQELDRALHPKLQKHLGISIHLDERYLTRPEFIAQFERGGYCWLLTYQAKPWGCDWFFRRTDRVAITQCTRQTLAFELKTALGQLPKKRVIATAA